ncbi:metallophosphoesterase [Variovorax sp. RA8]|uniref:metallophosphoesterase n=1 Tax=Variovorax sp. (strain JCM 16519 / RA8) TaxID=662548 RepID=UPI0013166E0B|nr:metallophosphoesterase [Variovorax sp. RA8]VTU35258.1 Calcineurin-like phosphoesterase [Variovorax sp. RA8]
MLTAKHPIRLLENPATGAKPLFSFVVVADTHVNEADGVSSSPCETNRLANDRARFVFHDISAMDPPPAFVLHLGDIVHPVPSLPTFAQAVECFKEIASPLQVPLHVAPGNHDVGDKKIDWMPADQVCDDYLATYREAFGPDFYCFDHQGTRFIAINSLLVNSGLDDEARQREWVQEQIDSAGGQRVFLFMHYPPYVLAEDERGSYDNIDEPGRTWLVEQMKHPSVEAVFAGHVHNFWYDRVGTADYYMLPSTAFLRHDLTEFYRVGPAVEYGRGDAEKFGYFVVDVYPRGHVAHSIRTHGRRMGSADSAPTPAPSFSSHPAMSSFDAVGAELRHPWTECQQIAATGGVQEFGRKWARNDYPFLALWEMGARLSKVPDLDFQDLQARSRMQLLARMGHRYVLTSLGRPPALSRADAEEAGVCALEVNATWQTLAKNQLALASSRQESGAQLFFSKIHTFDETHFDGKHFNHFVKAGFVLRELPDELGRIRAALAASTIDGITVRVEATEDLVGTGLALITLAEELQMPILVSLKTSGPNLATARADDHDFAARVAQAMLLSKGSSRLRFVFDTFMDVDRGYFPRQAFIDRRYDPRPGAQVYTALNATLSHLRSVDLSACSHGLLGTTGGQYVSLLHAPRKALEPQLRELPPSARVHDLLGGSRASRDDALGLLAQLPPQSEALLLTIH